MIHKSKQETVLLACAFALGALIVAWAIFYVPMSNDEPNHYHLLACLSHPFSYLDATSIRGCDHRFDLTTFFGLQIPRSLNYIGFFPSFLYAPLYYVWTAPASLYAYGLLYFAAFVVLMSRLADPKKLTAALLLSFFPLALNFIHDMGPLKLDMLLYPVGAWLFQKSLTEKGGRAYAAGATLAGLMFVAFESKPFFLYLLPGYFFFFLAFAHREARATFQRLGEAWRALLFMALLFGLLCGTLLLAKTQTGDMYVVSLLRIARGEGMPPSIWAGGQMLWSEKLFDFFLFLPHHAHRFLNLELLDVYGNYKISAPVFAVLLFPQALFYSLCGAAVFMAWRKTGPRVSARTLFLVLAALANLIMFVGLGHVYASHHFIFVWVPLLLLVADLMARSVSFLRLSLFGSFFAANLVAVLWLWQTPAWPETSFERAKITAFLNQPEAAQAIIGYISWGQHLEQSLFGPPDQIVTFQTTADDVRKFYRLAQEMNRPYYVICHFEPDHMVAWNNPCAQDDVQKVFSDNVGPSVALRDVPLGLEVWRVYEVEVKRRRILETQTN